MEDGLAVRGLNGMRPSAQRGVRGGSGGVGDAAKVLICAAKLGGNMRWWDVHRAGEEHGQKVELGGCWLCCKGSTAWSRGEGDGRGRVLRRGVHGKWRRGLGLGKYWRSGGGRGLWCGLSCKVMGFFLPWPRLGCWRSNGMSRPWEMGETRPGCYGHGGWAAGCAAGVGGGAGLEMHEQAMELRGGGVVGVRQETKRAAVRRCLVWTTKMRLPAW